MLCTARMHAFAAMIALTATLTFLPSPVRAANEGQADLDAAVEANLNAESLDDLAKVIKKCENALEKGLDESNTQFAKQLQVGALTRRANVLANALFGTRQRDVRWFEVRRLALNDLQKSLKIDENLPASHLLAARLEAAGGDTKDFENARTAIEAAIKTSKDDTLTHAKALVLRAALTEDNDKRLEDYNEAAKLAPAEVDVVRTRGLFLLLQGKNEAALADLEAACKLVPDHAETQVARGLTLMLLKRYDDSIAAFGKAIELVPDAPITHMHRARAYAAKKDWQPALADLDDAVKLGRPGDETVSPIVLRARVYQQMGDVDKAKADIDAAFQSKSDAVDPVQVRAVLFAGNGELSQGIVDLEELRKLAPKNVELLMQLGLLYTAEKHFDKAIDSFTAVLAEAPKRWQALRDRGDNYLSLGEHAKAVADLQAAMDIHPPTGGDKKLKQSRAGILNNLAWVLSTSPDEKVRDGKRAISLAIEACELTDYKAAHILSTLASSYAETGDFETAMKWSSKAVEEGEGDVKEQLGQELESYKNKKPWREAKTPDPDANEKTAAKPSEKK